MLHCLRPSYYDRNPDSCIRCRVHCLLFDTSSTEVDETYRTGYGSVCVGNTGLRSIFSILFWLAEPARMINNTMKSPTRNEMMREYYINSDVRDNPHYNITPQGREPFHPRKQTGPMASFMSTLQHERNLENKDSRLTTLRGCAPVDAPPC